MNYPKITWQITAYNACLQSTGSAGGIFSTATVPSPTITLTPTPPSLKPGDTNNDRIINLIDLNKVLLNFNKNLPGYSNGNFDGNGKINILDYNILVNNYGK
jgi:hypothetical protein